MRNLEQQLAHDVERVRSAIKPGPLGWSNEQIYRLLFADYADTRRPSFNETCFMFDWIDDIQTELRNHSKL